MILSDKKRIQDFTDKGWWGNDTLYSLFQDALAQCKDQEGLVDPENRPNITGDSPKRLTYQEIHETVERYAGTFFEQGMKKDDIAIVQLPNIVELPMVYLALSKLGVICSPVPMQYGAYEITSIIDETNPKAFISIQTFNGNSHAEKFSTIFNNGELTFSLGSIDGFIDLHKYQPSEQSFKDQQS